MYIFPIRVYEWLKVSRGAHGSAGRTSWGGKAELGDYVAFFGFMLCYISSILNEMTHSKGGSSGHQQAPPLILGGYSYGSLIASCLPPLELVSQLFCDAREGSAECEIKQRANVVGRDFAGYLNVQRGSTVSGGRDTDRAHGIPSSPSQGVAMGGYESDAASRRISRESSHKSLDTDKFRRSIDRVRERVLARTKSDRDVHPPASSVLHEGCTETNPSVAYLIISPVLPPISGLTTMFTKPTFERRDMRTRKIVVKDTSTKDEQFVKHPTCLIYGSKDMFTSAKKVQKWAQDLSSRAGQSFCSHEVEGAGHFWTEEHAAQRLQASLTSWLSTLDNSFETPSRAMQVDPK